MGNFKKLNLALVLCFLPLAVSAFPVDNTNKWAWGEETGYINFNPTDGNVDVTSTQISGHVWSHNTGWINLQPTNSGVTNTETYDGTNCTGVLGSYAWGQSTGWINFAGGSIDQNGVFRGTIVSDQMGSISFNGTNHSVETTWRSCVIDTDGDGDPDAVEAYNATDPNDPTEYTDGDGDGIPTFRDLDEDGTPATSGDSDGDTIPDAVECPMGYPCVDSDGDGTSDYLDTDSDDNSTPDSTELLADPDGDGIPAYADPDEDGLPAVGGDSDGDGIPDAVECLTTHPCADTDGDGVPDYNDTDSDGDGTPDATEGTGDDDNDGIPNNLDVDATDNTPAPGGDSDGDGIPDGTECPTGVVCVDTDGDTIPDYMDTDSDGDGVSDDLEPDGATGGAGPLGDIDGDGIPTYADLDEDGTPATSGDSDGDSLTDAEECPMGFPCIDTDGDGIPDYTDLDSDDDGISDATEGDGDTDNDGIPDYADPDGAGPGYGDSDNDGVSDYLECLGGFVCPDTDGDGTPDYLDLDHDNDGTPDSVEAVTDSDDDGVMDYFDDITDGNDSDGDGINDDVECSTGSPCIDTDGDGTPDYLDTDSDNDGIIDSVEGVTDTDSDGIPDYLDADNAGPGDSDGDGIPDNVECSTGAPCIDTDGDGVPDYMDTDSDNDGTTDVLEGVTDADSDGIPDYLDPDTNAGTPGGNPAGDADGDGILDSVEGTTDSDGDGIPNYLDLDSDGDGSLDAEEGVTDADGDGTPDYLDFDPQGFFYDEATGAIVPGGGISVVGPGLINIIKDGTDGEYQFFTDGTPGVYTATFIPPAGASLSSTCVAVTADPDAGGPLTASPFDPTGHPDDPIFIGSGANLAGTVLVDPTCVSNPFYTSFDLAPGDAFIFNNNIPLQVATASSGSGGATSRDVITVCDPAIDQCSNVFPTAGDQAYRDYQTCVNQGGANTGQDCAQQWAKDQGLLTFEEYLAQGGASPDVVSGEDFKISSEKISADDKGVGTCDYIQLERSADRRGTGLPTGYFTDTAYDHQAYTAAVDLAEQLIIHGDSDTHNLRIDDPISRAEAVKVYSIARQDLIAYEQDCVGNKFPDVVAYSWYHRYVENMRLNDIVHGYDDGFYRPARNINWAEIAKVSAISFGFITKAEADAIRSELGGEWYESYMSALKSEGVVPSWMLDFAPNKVVSRGDMFALISNILISLDSEQ